MAKIIYNALSKINKNNIILHNIKHFVRCERGAKSQIIMYNNIF